MSRFTVQLFARSVLGIGSLLVAIGAVGLACETTEPAPSPSPSPSPTPTAPPPDAHGVWGVAFEAGELGALSSVWGSGPNDVFVVGGTFARGEIYHYDGVVWRAMSVPPVSLLVWVFGLAPDDVYAVGLGGGAVHYDGTAWTVLDSGTEQDLWGIWGASPDDMWVVGGTVGDGEPLLMHFDGVVFSPIAVPENDLGATALFKVWGIGSKVIAVGANGLVIERVGDSWTQVFVGSDANEDFVSLWGTNESNIVLVGGRSNAQIAHFDGTTWTTRRPLGYPGLNGCFIDDADFAIIGGGVGWVGRYPPGAAEPIVESAPAEDDIHAVWGDGAGRYYAVGGQFRAPFRGVALVRTPTEPEVAPARPIPAGSCSTHLHCDDGDPCTLGRCAGGICTSVPHVCDDDDPCTLDFCTNGACVHTPIDCDDRDPCTVDLCVEGTCFSYDQDCDDGNACTLDTCSNGVCVHTPMDCDDGDLCTVDDCNGGRCTHAAVLCNDGDACTIDFCTNGACTSAPVICDDGNGCTSGTCDGGSCVFISTCGTNEVCLGDACVPAPNCLDDEDCDDGDQCRTHSCNGGECLFTPVVCHDGDPCTVDSCVDGQCVFQPRVCEDGNPCTTDACVNGACHFTQIECDDGNPCTTDACVNGTCLFTPIGCNDSNPCTTDTCVNGNCVFTPMVCNDDNLCTTDACINGACVFTEIPGCACTVESDCMLGKNCVDGMCQAGAGPDMEVGIGATSRGCIRLPYTPLTEYGELPICEGFQGFTDVFPDVRVTGFPAGAQVQVRGRLTYPDGPTCTSNGECPTGQTCNRLPLAAPAGICGPIGAHSQINGTLTDLGNGVGQFTNFGMIIFSSVNNHDGANVVLTIQVVQAEDEATSATQSVNVTLIARRLCLSSDTCPAGHSCDGNYCIP